jgi:hypothetical protein
VLPVEQLAADEPSEKELPPEILEAKVEIFFLTWALPHFGHTTPSIKVELRTSSSNDFSHCSQTNSKIGINISSSEKQVPVFRYFYDLAVQFLF